MTTDEVVRCKDCKHRPFYNGPEKSIETLEFPDEDEYICPCEADDWRMSWYPNDDWFCPRGERKEDENDNG